MIVVMFLFGYVKNVFAVGSCACEDTSSGTLVSAAGVDETACEGTTEVSGTAVANCQWIVDPSPVIASSTAEETGGPDSVPLFNPLSGTVGAQSIPDLVGGIIARLLGVLGSISLVVFMYGAFKWITSEGESDDIQEGTHTMAYAAIGILVIFASYGILQSIIGGITGG